MVAGDSIFVNGLELGLKVAARHYTRAESPLKNGTALAMSKASV